MQPTHSPAGRWDAAPPTDVEADGGLRVRFRTLPATDLTSEEVAGMLGLLEAAFGRWPSFELDIPPLDYLRWKLEGPGVAPTIVTLIEDRGRIVSLVLHLVREYLVEGRLLYADDSIDAAVHPDFQGKGLYRIRREVYDPEHVDPRYDFTISYSANERVLRVRARWGERFVANAPVVLSRVNHPLPTLQVMRARGNSRLRSAVAVGGLALLGGARGLGRRPPRRRSWTLRQVDRFDARADALFDETAPGFDFIQRRSERYLNWRYADPRGGHHELVIAEQGDRLLGYVAFRHDRERGLISDVLALPGREDVVASLLGAAVASLRDAAWTSMWLPRRHPYERAARALGFANRFGSTGMTMRPVDRADSRFEFLRSRDSRLHLVLGDSDWI